MNAASSLRLIGCTLGELLGRSQENDHAATLALPLGRDTVCANRQHPVAELKKHDIFMAEAGNIPLATPMALRYAISHLVPHKWRDRFPLRWNRPCEIIVVGVCDEACAEDGVVGVTAR
jgi:hypothetical protein